MRIDEADRATLAAWESELAARYAALAAAGLKVDEGENWLVVEGAGAPPRGAAKIAVELDHRVAMAFLVLGAACREGIEIDDARPIDPSEV